PMSDRYVQTRQIRIADGLGELPHPVTESLPEIPHMPMTESLIESLRSPTSNGRVALRPIVDADMPFLLTLYGHIRSDELARVPWSNEEKAAFVIQQLEAQHSHWQSHYFDTAWDLVLVDGKPAGRLYVARWPDEIRIVDIALLPRFRGAAIGSGLLGDLIAESERSGRKISIHVEIFNTARRLYERLGFQVADERGVYL